MRSLILISSLVLLSTGVGFLAHSAHAQGHPTIEVYKSPTCGCCTKWVVHLQEHGFTVNVTDVPSVVPLKERVGITPKLSSCHTALVGDYVLEGHVPASDVHRLLAEGPAIKGLAVPGMPIGSPGMEGPNAQGFDVYSFDRSGETEIYATHGK